ncbi:glycosyltransferase family 41 protein [Polychaeton citri CBS 116435]|uniref:protein O-GlcNAc transferase n=1 Tax=Polychaeton citri CBS 116435 TaxID=1314669 RepID=A0A9P4QA13_9PEZI|nr:glycosyltransferase family 41 protein [Polychaeton citri CBS 116435]
MPYMTHQYALPIHNVNTPQARAHASFSNYQHPLQVENTLRRKTPNGTLNAGYDGNLDDANPSKYQLLPVDGGAGPYFGDATNRPTKRTFLQHQQRQKHGVSSNMSARVPPDWSNPADSFSSQSSAFPVMDSMLHQMPSQQFAGQAFYSQTVPSVLQPPFQYLGPTASGVQGQGPYGPYWHDGTYVPYRPAVLRDPRFYNEPMAAYTGSIASTLREPQAHPWPPGQWSQSFDLHTGARQSNVAQANAHGLYGQFSTSYPMSPVAAQDPVSEYGPMSPNGRQRDRTFSWALQRYRELLVYIHHSRRQQQQQMRDAHGHHHVNHKPSFYPRPPKPSSHGSSIQIEKHRKLRTQPNDQQQHGSNRSLRRFSGSQIAPAMAAHLQDQSPPALAAAALSKLTRLCRDVEWQWTDGMHLGGCLSYGLGNYQEALKWYRKVLEMDPKHVEATSNLAATLLALGQRPEAEQQWMKVVKVAPNYFEAVEHLVGLLCSEHRSKDAIKIIEYVERCLRRQPRASETLKVSDRQSDCSVSTASRSPCMSELSDKMAFDFEAEGDAPAFDWKDTSGASEPGFGSSGFAIPGSDNGRILALIHAKGNMLYGLGDNAGAAKAFEDAVLIATGRQFRGIQDLVNHILSVVSSNTHIPHTHRQSKKFIPEPILLSPEQALATSKLCFPYYGELPGLECVAGLPQSIARKAVISTTSNSLLSLAKIFQDGMSNTNRSAGITPLASGVRDILALYYLSLSLQPSPSTANNVGILLASVQQSVTPSQPQLKMDIPGVQPGSGVALALQYYNYGLQLDSHHAHLYTNLGSLLKDIGQLDAAINMYDRAVKCDGKFDIALANLANAVKDKGRINDAISYYKRAVEVSPDFAEAVCGLANALNSVCSWSGRGGISDNGGKRDRWHVGDDGQLISARDHGTSSSGWLKRVVDIVGKQLVDGENWGRGTLTSGLIDELLQRILALECGGQSTDDRVAFGRVLRQKLTSWAGQKWEGARVTRLIERITRRITWHYYQDAHVRKRLSSNGYRRPQLPSSLGVPSAPTVLPFHTFTCPMSAKQIRLISQRNGLRISAMTLRAPWLSKEIHMPPAPPSPYLKVGYVSSDFNNHPLAHLMQSVFGLHNRKRVKAYCYATTVSDNSIHRQQIQAEAPVFYDVSNWSAGKLVNRIVEDGIHVLINLNGYTRGARNEVFAARPAPIQMSFMGFAGTLGAEWCDYLLADDTAVPPSTLRPWRNNVNMEDYLEDENSGSLNDDWIYGENIIYCRDTFFCCDHKQSAPGAQDKRLTWEEEQAKRWQMRKELFPDISDDTIIFGNFNQLYKIEPTTFRTWLRILARVPNAILWLLRFPDLGEFHLKNTALLWGSKEVASRVRFTDVAPKHQHISRASICDLVLDTPECNAHTTAADVLWSGTPLLTLPRFPYKMCSRMAASILKGALPQNSEGKAAARDLIAVDEDDYEAKAIALGSSLRYPPGHKGRGQGRLVSLRHMLYHSRWTCPLFDTQRWVRDLEDAYEEAWKRWVRGEGGDIWLDKVPRRT